MLCEMAAQCSCLLVADDVKGKTTLYAGMNRVKFKNPVRVGDTAEFTCSFLRAMPPFYFMKAEGYVGDKMILSGEFSFALIDSDKIDQ